MSSYVSFNGKLPVSLFSDVNSLRPFSNDRIRSIFDLVPTDRDVFEGSSHVSATKAGGFKFCYAKRRRYCAPRAFGYLAS
ncbi:hypothetical protein CH375_01330 [Leptospira ellisii]|uniref:Uncharacterized protein n=1 Tax=Leptospira ellisii TaxID=2023197 RepID=A0A2N0BQB4_9LEPT|nr:hypothetical protein CH379_16180 [Leptospira ellisii]PKA06134.1 hypothetical protein CH375_01330 [Leptospira ellisii]